MYLKMILLAAASLLLGPMAASVCLASSTESQIEEQREGELTPTRTEDGELTRERANRLAELLEQYEHLDRHFLLMEQSGVDEELERSLAGLRERSETAGELIQLYGRLSEYGSKSNQYFGEARWRALHLLARLRDPATADFFTKIATERMPDPAAVDESRYRVEYRMRARAIAGLEYLEATDRLRRIYGQGGLFKGLAAASLFELGTPPKGIVKVDPIKRLGYGDPKDYNPSEGETGLDVPSVKGRPPGSYDEKSSVELRWPTGEVEREEDQ